MKLSKTNRKKQGQSFMWGHLIGWILMITVVLFVLVFSPKLYGGSKTIFSLLPETCGSGQRTTDSIQKAMMSAVQEEKPNEAERLYDEWTGCKFEKQLDDETHFSTAKASYDHRMKQYDFEKAPRILRDYVKRIPPGAHKAQAEQMIANAERELKESPRTKLGELAQLAVRDWQAAKQGYKQLLTTLAAKPADYQTHFAKEKDQATQRYVKIEAEQIAGVDITFTANDARIDTASGNVKYDIRLGPRPGKPLPVYTIELSTESRSVEEPTKPILVRLRSDGQEISAKPPTSPLDMQANTVTATALIDSLIVQACPDTGGPIKCEPARVISSHIALLDWSYLPAPTITGEASGNGITFAKTPALPKLELIDKYAQFDAESQGQKYTMTIQVESYPTSKSYINWQTADFSKSSGKSDVGEEKANALTRATLLTLCPKYKPAPPINRDMSGELFRCLLSRQVFDAYYDVNFKTLPDLPKSGGA
ncbi:MAG: hypothetical protein AABX47_04030 [Nanoarchaeota archaeon]